MILFYYLVVFPISRMPWWMVYGFSDFLYWTGYKVFRYRTKVVNTNLKKSFPEKSAAEIKDIRRKFYRHFCDVMLEGIKMQTMTAEELAIKQTVSNPEIVDHLFEQGKGLIICTGHYNNWEYVATGINPWFKHQTLGIYHQFKSEFFERKMLEARSKTGMLLVSRKAVREGFFEEHKDPYAIFFGVDQSPTIAKKVYWMEFLNQETPVAFGAEKYAKERNYAVVFAKNEKVKRGHYRMTLEILNEDPLNTAHGEITEMHHKTLEKIIQEQPEYWLWSHKRWKRKRKAGE
ncbi:MAG: lysophospholipid acyltransferase family protein [Roseivirga sp.]|uniref:lysophospholipid acyltransferase family protein n=1 Tax=Roseivirga sp. TaxID=1964215 RepID=UPI001B0B46AF|nr:lysophospholipid acyltransferase family protein [Roseivirga sp.]MBO6661433.1 lysophospholipid acyltransferase family protein [Roseivirga sp.]MBO6908583.1 lysophospholipid acyltransferase family protein [Roseivirga sp.]